MKRVILRKRVRIFRRAARGSTALQLTGDAIPARSIIALECERMMKYRDCHEHVVLFAWQGYRGYVLVREAPFLEIIK